MEKNNNNLLFFNYYGNDINNNNYAPGRFLMSLNSPSTEKAWTNGMKKNSSKKYPFVAL